MAGVLFWLLIGFGTAGVLGGLVYILRHAFTDYCESCGRPAEEVGIIDSHRIRKDDGTVVECQLCSTCRNALPPALVVSRRRTH